MNRPRTDEIADELEAFLRRTFQIRDDDPVFSRQVNLWEEGYVDSVGVVETIVHLERLWSVTLPEEVIFDPRFTHVDGIAGMIEGLVQGDGHREAAAVAGAADSSLVLMQPGGEDSVPLFLVHAADGALLPYANLARRLAGDRPVYGLQPQATAGLPLLHTRVEEMAEHYVDLVRRVRPRGPYLLGGLCGGAVIGCEMARLLEAQDEEVRLVMFDAADPAASRRAHLYMRRRVDRVRQALAECNLLKLPGVLGRKLAGFADFEWRRQQVRTQGRLAMAAIRLCRRSGVAAPRWVRSVPVTTLCTLAVEGYRAAHRVRGEILLFRATSGSGDNEPYSQVYVDPLLGWESRTAKGVRCIDVPGGHLSMLQEPFVSVLADRLRACLRPTGPSARALLPSRIPRRHAS